jgi:hypothetical protein
MTTGEDPLRAWHLRQLRRSLRGLAMAGVEDQALFPGWAMSADELAFDFDHWASVVRSGDEEDLTRAQRDALAAIDAKLATISKDGAEFDLDLWTEAALRTSGHWDEVRRHAAAALEAFGWLEEEPAVEPDQ